MDNMRVLGRVVAIAICFVSAAPEVAAQTSGPAPPSIRVAGRATVLATPNQAEIDLGIVSQADSSHQASADNADRLNRVLGALWKALGRDATMRTVTYSLRPNYRQPGELGGEPAISGYTATNVVRVTVPDVGKVGSVIDAAAVAGANRVDRVRFTLREEHTVRSEVLRKAAADARTQAQALASALDLRIVRVLSASDETSPAPQFTEAAQAVRLDVASFSTPIEAGPLEITATVTLTVEVIAASPP